MAARSSTQQRLGPRSRAPRSLFNSIQWFTVAVMYTLNDLTHQTVSFVWAGFMVYISPREVGLARVCGVASRAMVVVSHAIVTNTARPV